MKPGVLVIAGPTASGKTAVALELAQTLPGEIVNGDSRQIYRGLAAGTDQPAPGQKALAPHHLYDFLDPRETFSAGDYRTAALSVIQEIHQRRSLPIVVGGTGLYLKALLEGIAPLPKRDAALRAELLALAEKKGRKHLHQQLQQIDPVSAGKIPYQNIQRVVRALEVYHLTRKPLSQWHLQEKLPPVEFPVSWFGLLWPREKLKERIRERTEKILPEIVREAAQLKQQGLSPADPGLQSLGYRQAFDFLEEKISREACFQSLFTQTLHYAKRQMTWFRSHKQIQWIEMAEPFRPAEIAEQIRICYNKKISA